jgi:vacuolar-type H+-ATPase subunit C/Vma6
MKSLARYATTNAITRTMLSELLTKDDFQTLAKSESLQGAWMALRKTAYGDWIGEDVPTEILGIEKVLREVTASRFRRSIQALRGAPREVAVRLLARWELDNLQFALRLWHGKDLGLQEFLTHPSPVNDIPIYDVTEAESLEEIALALRHTPYFEPVSVSLKAYRERHSIFFVEMELERDYWRRLLAAAASLGGTDTKQAGKVVAAEIDLVNLAWLTRLIEYYDIQPPASRAYMIPGPSELSRRLAGADLTAESFKELRSTVVTDRLQKQGGALSHLDTIALIESMIREMAVDMARSALAGYPFSIGCVFAFYLLKRTELANLETLFAGKFIGTSEADITARLHGLR